MSAKNAAAHVGSALGAEIAALHDELDARLRTIETLQGQVDVLREENGHLAAAAAAKAADGSA